MWDIVSMALKAFMFLYFGGSIVYLMYQFFKWRQKASPDDKKEWFDTISSLLIKGGILIVILWMLTQGGRE